MVLQIMKRISIVSIISLFLIISLFNSPIVAESKYKAEWQELIKNNQKIIKKNDEKEDKKEDKNIKAHFRLGVAYANLGKIDRAKKEFDLLSDLNDGQTAKSIIKYYEARLEKNPDNAMFLNYLGFANYASHNYKVSLKLFKKIIKNDPKNIWSYNYLGTIYGKLEKYDQAEKVLQKSLELEENRYTHFLLGAVYYKQGRIFKALYHIGQSGKVATKLLEW
ncbi:MAG: hypothetical protein AWU54_1533 [Candidatus Frackibacter sp. T328-2]|nr:MAG: hypothetical protein AWU54_1533 [Candidatus Frackibacter sp. T328-2]